MLRLLFIKTSSLGDVMHNMPALTDVRRRFADAHIAWVVEEAYAPLVRLHPAVDEVITVATRRWRREWMRATAWREMAAARQALRGRGANVVIDTQGLVRSALLAWFAHGVRHGYDRASIREPAAAAFYDVRHRVPKVLHAIERNRLLTAAALDYAVEEGIDYGLPHTSVDRDDHAVVLHGSAQPRKEWAEENWAAALRALEEQGLTAVLASGNARERERSERLARHLQRPQFLHAEPLDRVAGVIAKARLVVGLDTGLLHVAAAFATPLVGIFGASDPRLTGPRGTGRIAIVGDASEKPGADDVLRAIREMLDGDRVAPPRDRRATGGPPRP